MSGVSRFKAVFFDAGGTLFKPHPSVGEIYSEVAARYGCEVNAGLIESQFREEWTRRDRNPSLSGPPLPTLPDVAVGTGRSGQEERQWWYDLVKDVFSKFGGVNNYESFFSELYDIFARPEYWQIFPEVEEVIRGLKEEGLVLGVVSNWDSRLIPLCEKLGLGRFFNFVLASGLVGSSKPDIGIFQEALKRSGVEPREALHVGDSLKDDVEGPMKLGIQAILVDRSGQRKYPVPTIRSLSELIPLIIS